MKHAARLWLELRCRNSSGDQPLSLFHHSILCPPVALPGLLVAPEPLSHRRSSWPDERVKLAVINELSPHRHLCTEDLLLLVCSRDTKQRIEVVRMLPRAERVTPAVRVDNEVPSSAVQVVDIRVGHDHLQAKKKGRAIRYRQIGIVSLSRAPLPRIRLAQFL